MSLPSKNSLKSGGIYFKIIAKMPLTVADRAPLQGWIKLITPVRFIVRTLWRITALIAELLGRWFLHALGEFFGRQGYVIIGAFIAFYTFIYSLADSTFQRGEVNASLRLSTFVSLVSGEARSSFIVATKGIGAVQTAESFMPPSFWDFRSWFVPAHPNERFIADWAREFLSECTNQTCGTTSYRINLRNARWDKVSMPFIDIHNADMTEASGYRANLLSSDFRNATLFGSSFWYAVFGPSNFDSADLRCANFPFSQINYFPGGSDTSASLPSFNRTDLRGANFQGAELRRAILDDANLSPFECGGGTYSTTTNLAGVDANGASFRRADLRRTIFQQADLRDAILVDADLRNANFIGADLRGADLSGAQLEGAYYSLSTKWPDGFSYIAAGVVLIREQSTPN